MDDLIKKLEMLLTMFDTRDNTFSKNTRQIASVIQPTVLEALYDLFELERDQIEWLDLQVLETMLLVVCNVTYDPATNTSQFLSKVDEAQRPETPIQVQRLLRVGVPLVLVFSPKDEIKDFLLNVPVETTDVVDEDVPVGLYERMANELSSKSQQVMGFDTDGLSDDQVAKLKLYQSAQELTKQ